MPEKLKLYWRLARLDRPVGWLLLLWPTLWALWIAADGHPRPAIVAIFVLGVITMRAAGCVINDIFDRDLDPLVERTRNRPLASGAVTVREALVIFFLLLTIAFGPRVAPQSPDGMAGGGWCCDSRKLSLGQAIHKSAAGISGRGIFVGYSDGIHRSGQPADAAGLVAAGHQPTLDGGL